MNERAFLFSEKIAYLFIVLIVTLVFVMNFNSLGSNLITAKVASEENYCSLDSDCAQGRYCNQDTGACTLSPLANNVQNPVGNSSGSNGGGSTRSASTSNNNANGAMKLT